MSSPVTTFLVPRPFDLHMHDAYMLHIPMMSNIQDIKKHQNDYILKNETLLLLPPEW